MRSRQRDGLNLRKIELRRSVIDVEADDVPLRVEIDHKAFHDLARLRAGRFGKLDIRGCPFPDSSAASWRVLAEVT